MGYASLHIHECDNGWTIESWNKNAATVGKWVVTQGQPEGVADIVRGWLRTEVIVPAPAPEQPPEPRA